MIYLEIKENVQKNICEDKLKQAVLATLDHLDRNQNIALTLVITGNEQIQTLNRQYRDDDAPTDVLSFTSGHTDPETGKLYLGDVLISYPQAKSQAKTRGHHVDDELQLLVVHGVLHLLDYDHLVPNEKEHMWDIQESILAKLDLDIDVS